jgi:alkanesulfonate monooxygenase SsuD/methylene tetrahydromethanopterin reductase-like flavin-dependent oxidoreductase (luciferase family)
MTLQEKIEDILEENNIITSDPVKCANQILSAFKEMVEENHYKMVGSVGLGTAIGGTPQEVVDWMSKLFEEYKNNLLSSLTEDK